MPPAPRGPTWKLPEKYEVRELIGSGCFGSVCEVYDREKGQLVAIKRMRHMFEDLRDARKILLDLAILSELDHDYILRIYDIVADADHDPFQEIYAVMEICDCDLKKLCRNDVNLTPLHTNTLLYNLLVGVNYLHSAGIIHCELKPANCMVNQDCSVKICDFRSSRVLRENQPAQALRSTPRKSEEEPATAEVTAGLRLRLKRSVKVPFHAYKWYSAPELLLMQEDITGAADLWSVACIYAELIGMLPGTNTMDRGPLFPGTSYLPPSPRGRSKCPDRGTQFGMIFRILGTPSEAELQWLDRDAREYIIAGFYAREAEGEEPLASKFPQVDAESIAMLKQLLAFVPAARPSAGEALSLSMFNDVRDPAREVLASHRVQLRFLEEADLDEKLLRTYFCKEIAKFPARDFFVTLHARDLSPSCVVLACTNMAGDEVVALNLPDPQQSTLGDVRQKIVMQLQIRASYLKLLLPCGRLLGNADNSTPLYDLLATCQEAVDGI